MPNKRWSDQEILDALKAWADEHGRSPKWNDWQYAGEGRPTATTVWFRCGSWADALVMAGLEPPTADSHAFEKKFSRPEARMLRKQGLSDVQIAERLGVHNTTIGKALGPREDRRAPGTVSRKKKLKNRTREERLADLRAAIERQET